MHATVCDGMKHDASSTRSRGETPVTCKSTGPAGEAGEGRRLCHSVARESPGTPTALSRSAILSGRILSSPRSVVLKLELE